MNQLELKKKNSFTLIDHLYSTNSEEITDVKVPAYCPGDHYSAVQSISKTSEIWKHLKDLDAESSVTFQGSEVNEPGKVCEHFNEHFGTVAESIIPNHKSNFKSPKLNEFIEEKVGDNYFEFYCLSPIEISNELLKVKIAKSTGLDDVGLQIKKISAPIMFGSVAHIFNLGLCTGISPSTFKVKLQ
ncbi:unnamed protein product [Mytilus coruscus]|uniref:Uncharacterized protein n=1 Tax=Mytilus coruscus TaxID=42192 RepID=A0A6J8AAQ5_MYTCO|nr:unnamed protein product [Mytilus coruscus]